LTLTVRRAGVDDLDALSRLFDAYRRFYRQALLATADHGRSVGAVRLALTTQWNNTVAQTAYEHLGWAPSNAFKAYNFAL
jgi:hypothetical protein